MVPLNTEGQDRPGFDCKLDRTANSRRGSEVGGYPEAGEEVRGKIAIDTLKQREIDHAIAQQEFTELEDGYLYWFPSSRGGLEARQLRVIADYLDQHNKHWNEEVDRYFSGFSVDENRENF